MGRVSTSGRAFLIKLGVPAGLTGTPIAKEVEV